MLEFKEEDMGLSTGIKTVSQRFSSIMDHKNNANVLMFGGKSLINQLMVAMNCSIACSQKKRTLLLQIGGTECIESISSGLHSKIDIMELADIFEDNILATKISGTGFTNLSVLVLDKFPKTDVELEEWRLLMEYLKSKFMTVIISTNGKEFEFDSFFLEKVDEAFLIVDTVNPIKKHLVNNALRSITKSNVEIMGYVTICKPQRYSR